MRKKINKKIYLLGILFAFAISLWTAVFASQDGRLHMYVYDVGQGDAIYIRSPKNQDIIIDGGPDSTILSKLGRDMPFYDRKIELMILTHPHSDHLLGLIDILKRYNVDQILCSDNVADETKAYQEWQDLISKKKILKKEAEIGQQIYLGGAKIEILYSVDKEPKISDLNDTSIVGRLTFGQTSILLTGDASQNVEKQILAQKNKLKSNVLKVGHHGSKNSTSFEFLEKVKPQYAIISVGENKYGHPHKETQDRLSKIGAKILRTDIDGDIKCTSDGNRIECSALNGSK